MSERFSDKSFEPIAIHRSSHALFGHCHPESGEFGLILSI